MRSTSLVAAVAVIASIGASMGAGIGCRESRQLQRIEPELIAVSEIQTVRTDTIADAGRAATFVLVDAENRANDEALVTLGGEWLDAGGAVVGALRRETLRVPSGGRRTFALLDSGLAARPTAVKARLQVVDAAVPTTRAPMRIIEGKVYQDQGRAVVAGYLANDSDRGGRAIVIAGFHDADGKPMTRPFTLFEIGGVTKLPARFVGPPGSVSAYMFVGDVVY
jgi:hypothetical protein